MLVNTAGVSPSPGTADEVANVAELLLSNRGAFITGADFLIDGSNGILFLRGLKTRYKIV